MPILEVGDDNMLHVPAELLPGGGPHTLYELEQVGSVAMLRPAEESRPFWQRATGAERAEAFRQWAQLPRPATPDLPDEALRRESLYD